MNAQKARDLTTKAREATAVKNLLLLEEFKKEHKETLDDLYKQIENAAGQGITFEDVAIPEEYSQTLRQILQLDGFNVKHSTVDAARMTKMRVSWDEKCES